MDEFTLIGVIGVAVLVGLFFTRMPVAYVMAFIGFLGYSYLTSWGAGFKILSRDIYQTFSSYGLTLIPLFTFMGYIAHHAGISARLYEVAYVFFGRIRGGLAMATVAACSAFGAVCGSATATAATMAVIGLPEMKRYNYGSRLATGAVAAGGGLGSLMPPSVVLNIYGILTEQSIGKLFIAGIVPALLTTALFIVAIFIYCRIHPDQGPAAEKFGIKTMLTSLGKLWETIMVFVFVMGGLFLGLFTPTKAGAVGSFCMLVIAMFRGTLSVKGLIAAVNDTLKTSCMVLMLIAGATLFGHFLALSRIPLSVAQWVGSLSWPAWSVMAMMCLIYLIGGCFIDALPLIMLTLPIFYPIAMGLGYDPFWFGVVIVLVTQMGIITPPVGVNAYVVSGLAKDVPLVEVFRGCIPFLISLWVALAFLIIFPSIVTFLPSMVQ